MLSGAFSAERSILTLFARDSSLLEEHQRPKMTLRLSSYDRNIQIYRCNQPIKSIEIHLST